MERRKFSSSKSSPLPSDYLKMIEEVFTSNFDSGLKVYSQRKPKPRFVAQGAVFADEILLSVSLMSEGQMSATTVSGSSDFDSKASSPTVEDLLSICVDAIGSLFSGLLNPETPEIIDKLAEESLAALEDVPFAWTPVEVERRQVFVKIDKSNLELDEMTDTWLSKNDPEYEERKLKEQKEIEELFVTGPSASKKRTDH